MPERMRLMNKTECVKAALAHVPCDKVPYAINLTGEYYQTYGEQLLKEYASEKIRKDYEEGRFGIGEAFSLAIGNYMVCVCPPWWGWDNVPDYFSEEDTPEDFPHAIGTGSYDKFFEEIKYIKENYDVYMLVTIWGSHFEKAYFCRGIENFLADLAADPDWCDALLERIIQKNLVMLENISNSPYIDGIPLGSDWGSQNDLLMSPDVWRKLIKDRERREYELIRSYGKNVFVHSCGNIERILPDLVELKLEGLNPVQPECMNLENIKNTYGSALTFWGGISTQRTLPYGTPEEVRQEASRVIRMMSQNGGYITAPSQEIQIDVPYDNLKALIATAKEFG